jgi:hypothetical protein
MATFFACSLFIRVGLGKIKGLSSDKLFMETYLDYACELHVVKINKGKRLL